MPTLSEVQEHAADAEHQAFQRAYDALLNVAKDPITCRHFWDAGFTAGQADANDMLTVAHMDGYAKGRDAMRAELARQGPVAYGYPNTAITGKRHAMMMVRLDILSDDQYGGAQWVPLYAAPPDMWELVEALQYCRNLIGASRIKGSDQTLRMADAALTKHRGQS